MTPFIISIIAILIAYLCGSIPVGFLISRLYGIDVTASGSGRTGGSNVFRTAGAFAGALTFLGDVIKALIPVYLIAILGMPLTTALAATATVVGHNYSIFLGFRGGAGGGPAAGALTGMSFLVGLIAAICALLALSIARYASVVTSTIAFSGFITLIITAILGYTPYEYIIGSGLNVILIAYALRPNYARLRAGTERKIGQKTENIAKVTPRH